MENASGPDQEHTSQRQAGEHRPTRDPLPAISFPNRNEFHGRRKKNERGQCRCDVVVEEADLRIPGVSRKDGQEGRCNHRFRAGKMPPHEPPGSDDGERSHHGWEPGQELFHAFGVPCPHEQAHQGCDEPIERWRPDRLSPVRKIHVRIPYQDRGEMNHRMRHAPRVVVGVVSEKDHPLAALEQRRVGKCPYHERQEKKPERFQESAERESLTHRATSPAPAPASRIARHTPP